MLLRTDNGNRRSFDFSNHGEAVIGFAQDDTLEVTVIWLWRPSSMRGRLYTLLLLMPFATGRAQTAPPAASDVTAAPAQVSQRAPEPALDGLVRADKNTLTLALAKQKLLLYGFEFNGDTVSTEKLHLKQLGLGVFEVTSIAYTVGEWRVRIRDAADYYGLGERFDTLNHAHTVVHNLSQSDAGAKGSSTSKPMPFFMSTTGYGVWFDTTGDATFDMNVSSKADVIVDADAEKLRIVLFTGPEFPKILEAFTAQAGRSVLRPYWAFAPWLGLESQSDAHLQSTLDEARSLNLPASVILSGSATVVSAAVKHLHDEGYKLIVRETPSVDSKSSNYAEAAASGFFVKASDGSPYLARSNDSFLDFTNPRAKLWWQNQVREMIHAGADGFRDGDTEPEFSNDVKFNDESDERVMRNRYAVLYGNAMQEVVEKDLQGNGVLFVRNATVGANGLGFLRLEGSESSFSSEGGLPTVITAGLNAGLSGMPLWTADLGGYEASNKPDPQLFMRWTEYAAFTPVMETLSNSNLQPWDYGEQTTSVYRRFSTLHMSLFPYRYAAAQEAAKTGMPIMRALVLNYQDDEQARPARNEYLFGPDLLVAPIVDQGTQRTVYLPQGAWLDYWTGKPVAAGHVIVADAAVDTIPVYVRQGAIVPKIPDDVMTLVPMAESGNKGLKTLDDRRVYELFGEVAGVESVAITDFEGRKLVRSGGGLKIDGDSAAHIILRWRFQRVAGVTVNGAAAKLQSDALGSFVEFDHLKESVIAWR